jgi:Cd2+/Zn2+-exporting ATPase
LLVGILFVIGVILQRAIPGSLPPLVIFLLSTSLGLLPVLHAAFISLCRYSLDIHILMVMAVAGAIVDKEYLDASLLMSLFIGAEMIEEVVMQRVRKAIKITSGSIPKKAVLTSGKSVNVDELRVGDSIAVRAGEMIQADGVVSKGDGVVDESALTGEAAPVSKKKGDRTSSGTVVQNGYLEILVDTAIENSTMRKLNQAVMDVQADKGVYGRIVDKIAMYWTPGVLICATAIAAIGGGVTNEWDKYIDKVRILCIFLL